MAEDRRRADLYWLAYDYLVSVVAAVTEVPIDILRDADPADPFVLTSVQNLQVVSCLEGDLGELPVTLLFEHPSPNGLASRLIADKRAELTALLDEP